MWNAFDFLRTNLMDTARRHRGIDGAPDPNNKGKEIVNLLHRLLVHSSDWNGRTRAAAVLAGPRQEKHAGLIGLIELLLTASLFSSALWTLPSARSPTQYPQEDQLGKEGMTAPGPSCLQYVKRNMVLGQPDCIARQGRPQL